MKLEDVQRVTVLGAGNMGHGIAEVAALAGYDVSLRDINDELVQNGYDQIEWSLGKLAEKDRIGDDEADAALDRVDAFVDLEDALDGADVVVEVVPEKMAIKKDVYDDVVAHAPDEAVFVTNTSSLSITELSEVTDRPERFCGMHFFNPPVRMDLVEVISGKHTSEETLELIEGLAESMGKTPVRVRKDSPGFIVNRILVPLMNEAAWIVESGDATMEAVDSTTKFDMGLPMGSFELADQVGIDVGYHVLEYMHETLGEAYRPCPLLVEKVEADELGKKTGEGFYDYEDGDGASFGSFDVVFAALDFDYGRKLGRIERLADEHGDALTDEERDRLDGLREALSLFGPAREHVKTLYFQWALIDLSRLILYAAVPALVVAGAMVTVVDAGTFSGSTLGVAHVTLAVGGAFAVTLLPFSLFVAYVLRVLTLAKRTLAIGPLVLRDSE